MYTLLETLSKMVSASCFFMFTDKDGNKEETKLLNRAKSGEPSAKKYSEGIINEAESNVDEKSPPSSSQSQGHEILVDEPKTARLLAFVQILTASFASFAHGSNDVRLVKLLKARSNF